MHCGLQCGDPPACSTLRLPREEMAKEPVPIASEVGRLREAHARVVQPTPPPPYGRLKQETTARDARRIGLPFCPRFPEKAGRPDRKKSNLKGRVLEHAASILRVGSQ